MLVKSWLYNVGYQLVNNVGYKVGQYNVGYKVG